MSFVRYETSVPKSRQMVTERWLADVEMLRELPRGHIPRTQQLEDTTPRGVGAFQ